MSHLNLTPKSPQQRRRRRARAATENRRAVLRGLLTSPPAARTPWSLCQLPRPPRTFSSPLFCSCRPGPRITTMKCSWTGGERAISWNAAPCTRMRVSPSTIMGASWRSSCSKARIGWRSAGRSLQLQVERIQREGIEIRSKDSEWVKGEEALAIRQGSSHGKPDHKASQDNLPGSDLKPRGLYDRLAFLSISDGPVRAEHGCFECLHDYVRALLHGRR